MSRSKLDHDEDRIHAAHGEPSLVGDDPIDEAPDDQGEIIATAATIAVVAVGAAVFEAALLPGIALGVVATLAPRALPSITAALGPAFRSSIRGVYQLGQRTREIVAEAQEHVSDIVAEADAEARSKVASDPKSTAPAA